MLIKSSFLTLAVRIQFENLENLVKWSLDDCVPERTCNYSSLWHYVLAFMIICEGHNRRGWSGLMWHILASTRENLTLLHANNKAPVQTVHPASPQSDQCLCYLPSGKYSSQSCNMYVCSIFILITAAEEAVFSLTLSETLKTNLLALWGQVNMMNGWYLCEDSLALLLIFYRQPGHRP